MEKDTARSAENRKSGEAVAVVAVALGSGFQPPF